MWLLAHAAPQREFAAASILQDKFRFDVYLPVIKEPTPKYSVHNHGQPFIKRPFLPRYLFIKEGTGDAAFSFYNGNLGLFKLFRFTDKTPIKVQQRVIDRMQAREDKDGFIELDEKVRPGPSFLSGDVVRVVDDNGYDMWDGLFKRMVGSHRAELFAGLIGSSDYHARLIVPLSRIVRI